MSMFRLKSILLIAALSASSAAFASVNLHGEAGSEFTNLSASFNPQAPGMTFNGNWAHSDNDGDTVDWAWAITLIRSVPADGWR